MDNPHVDNWVLTGIWRNALTKEDSVGCQCTVGSAEGKSSLFKTKICSMNAKQN